MSSEIIIILISAGVSFLVSILGNIIFHYLKKHWLRSALAKDLDELVDNMEVAITNNTITDLVEEPIIRLQASINVISEVRFNYFREVRGMYLKIHTGSYVSNSNDKETDLNRLSQIKSKL